MRNLHQDASEIIHTRCCVVGGGPAGMMLGLLLARAGVDVTVLEKHADFFRDFRGDTIHPSTLEVMHELGILEDFLKLPHQQARQLGITVDDETIPGPDFSKLPTRCKFIALMPQWDFLNFLSEHAKRYPNFHLKMDTEATDLIFENERVTGVRATSPGGELEIHCDLVVGADGRHSTVRQRGGFEIVETGVPIDVLWFRISRKTNDPEQTLGFVKQGKMMVMINRQDYWQCGDIIRKGTLNDIQQCGLEAYRKHIAKMVPFTQSTINELTDWNQVKLLTVQINRLKQWYRPGLLCIGDSAHAMSPAGGVGINLAIQDAVATANILGPKLAKGHYDLADLNQIQQRREWPVRATQALQAFIHQRLFGRPPSEEKSRSSRGLVFKIMKRFPIWQHLVGRVIGLGFRPEHIIPK